MKNKTLILMLVVLLLLVAGFAIAGYLQTSKTESKGIVTLKTNVLGVTKEKSYEFENITALELLQKENDVNLTYSQYGAFIQCINSICSDSNNYWMYYVNNELAPAGADAYKVRNNEIIEFRYGLNG
ncbi:MAG: DUF4430 domain-containing protein [archaeon]